MHPIPILIAAVLGAIGLAKLVGRKRDPEPAPTEGGDDPPAADDPPVDDPTNEDRRRNPDPAPPGSES